MSSGLHSIESSGNLFLKKNADNELFLQTSSSNEIFAVTTSYSGSALTQENWSGWHAKAAETIDNQNYIAFVNSSDNRVWAAKVSSTGVYSSGTMYTSGTDAYNAQETAFNFDFDGNGTIGTPTVSYTSIEDSGNLFLKKNADNELFLQTSSSDEIFAVTTSSGSALIQENWSGWHAKAAETIDNQSYIAFVNSSDNRVWAAKVSSSGVYSSGAMYTSGTDDYKALETSFNYDFNGDSIIGAPTVSYTSIEDGGNLFLKKNADNELFLQTSSSNEIFAVQRSTGAAFSVEEWTNWHAKAAETIDNQNYVAFVNSSDNRVWAAKVSSSGVYSSGTMYTSGTDDYNELEAYANYDFNGDGAIGQTI